LDGGGGGGGGWEGETVSSITVLPFSLATKHWYADQRNGCTVSILGLKYTCNWS
jgi:hypothetical protein